MNVAGLSGLFPAGGARLFFVPVVEHAKYKRSLWVTVSASLGQDISQLTKLPRWMMTGNLFFRVSEVAGIMIAVIRSMLSDMKRGK